MAKKITEREKDFARLMEEVGLGSIEAYRKAFATRCETPTQKMKARDLARAERVVEYRNELKEHVKRQRDAQKLLGKAGRVDIDRMRDFVYRHLIEIRDGAHKGAVRLAAVRALQQLHDPSRDEGLIMIYMDIAWRYQQAHCPCCHKTFPLFEIDNPKLDEWRKEQGISHQDLATDLYSRRFEIVKMADKRLRPGEDQEKALKAPERHIVGQGAARAGKSYLMALMALMAFLIPGVEIWVLARVYDDARSEVEYLRKFLRNLFHPYYDLIIKELDDKKSGELTFLSKWGSELKIRSAKSKGSITGRELELALIAEPAWVDATILNHLLARMSSRLGRILAFGTPQGTAGILGRLVRAQGRDPITKKIVRRSPEERLIENGCSWGDSMLVYTLRPEKNPAYVLSELDASRGLLTDAEYASEFEGRIEMAEGKKFHVTDRELVHVEMTFFEQASYVLAVDQGPKNFGAVLLGYDGDRIVPCWEYFNGDETTMKKNLLKLKHEVPKWIQKLGGRPENWVLTITDVDPQLSGTFEEMTEEGVPWPTDVTYRHRNNAKLNENWRREVQEWVNNLVRQGKLFFHLSNDMSVDEDQFPGASLLHDQVMNALDVAESPDRESKTDSSKGWIINDQWRKDHVVDAWMFGMWTILSGQLLPPEESQVGAKDPVAEYRAAFQYQFARQEQQELCGGVAPANPVKFEDFFGRQAPGRRGLGRVGYYPDEG